MALASPFSCAPWCLFQGIAQARATDSSSLHVLSTTRLTITAHIRTSQPFVGEPRDAKGPSSSYTRVEQCGPSADPVEEQCAPHIIQYEAEAQERDFPFLLMTFGQIIQTINHSSYRLDLSGIVGLLGGDSAVDALETIHLHAGRRWVGWYNYTGSMTVAKRFGQIAKSRIWDSLFPGHNESPAATFNLTGKSGPEYNGSFSGTKLRTSYLGYLMAQKCKELPDKSFKCTNRNGTERRWSGSTAALTIIPLLRQPEQKRILISVTPKRGLLAPLAIIPSLVSVLACVFCILGGDFLCTSLILFCIVSSGLSSIALGTAALKIRVPPPSINSLPGDGLMFPEDGSIIVLKGEEGDVNIITKGEFELDYSTGILPDRRHHTIGVCSLLLLAQSLAQLLLIPLCTFFGQIMFLISLVVSQMYHLYVSSHEREGLHRELLVRELSPRMDKRILGTRTQMAVFACLALGDGRPEPLKYQADETLKRIVPNETPVWEYWRRKVLRELAHFWKQDANYEPVIQAGPEDATDANEYQRFTSDERRFLEHLIDDAWCVFKKYPEWRDSEFAISQPQSNQACFGSSTV